MKRIAELVEAGGGRGFDSLRLLAAAGVLVSHSFSLCLGSSCQLEPVFVLTRGGWTLGAVCVALFFVVSGFLIAQSAERNRSILRFTEKRALRIFPALMVNVVLTAFVLGPLVTSLRLREYLSSPETYAFLKLGVLIPHVARLPGVFDQNSFRYEVNGSLWTLHFEVACYAAAALFGYAFRFRSRVAFLFLAGVTITAEIVRHLPVDSLLHLFNLFLAGSLLYWFREYIPVSRTASFIGVLVFALSLRFSFLVPLASVCFAYAVIVTGYVWQGMKILHHRDYSYGLYLWAFPVQQTLLLWRPLAWWQIVLLALPITIILAMLSWHFVEKPAKAVKLTLSGQGQTSVQSGATDRQRAS